MASTATWNFDTNLSAAISGSDITAASDATNVNCAIFTRTTLTYATPVLQVAPQASTLSEAAAITNGVYFTVTVTGTGTISRFQIKGAKGGSGTRGIAVRSSADAYAANLLSSGSIATTRPTLTSYDTGTISIALSGTVTFRIYVYAPTNASTVELDDIVVTVDPAGGSTYTLTAAAGSYALTGTAAGLTAQRRVVAANGSYSLTGVAAGLLAGRRLVAANGAYTLTGAAAALLAGRRLPAASGSYALTGAAASLLAGRRTVAAAGSYVLTGGSVTFIYTSGSSLSAQAGAYALTGADVTLTYTPIAREWFRRDTAPAQVGLTEVAAAPGIGAFVRTPPPAAIELEG